MIRFKEGVNFSGMVPQMNTAFMVGEQVYAEHKTDLTITSLNDGEHSLTSLHYDGRAADFRIRNPNIEKASDTLPDDDLEEVVEQIEDRLGRHWDVVLEEDHIHVEYQPRKP